MIKGLRVQLMPLALIALGFVMLNFLPAFIAGTFMVIGIVMIIECKWPEKWGSECENQ